MALGGPISSPADPRATLDAAGRYPRRAALRAGKSGGAARVSLRLTRPDDRAAIDALVERLPKDDLLFARTYLTQDGLTIDWIADADAFWTMAVVAERGGAIVGFAHLHADPASLAGRRRAPADIQFVVAPEMRGRGLGVVLAKECVWIAEQLGLSEVQARVTSGQPAARAVFERVGFVPAALLPDGARTADGRARHIVVMRRTAPAPADS